MRLSSREHAVVLLLSIFAGGDGPSFRVKNTDKRPFFINHNARLPSISFDPMVTRDSRYAASVIGANLAIQAVLTMGCSAKIPPAVIQLHPVDVLRSPLHTQHQVVHLNDFLFAAAIDRAHSIETIAVRRRFSHPLPLIQPSKIGSVHDGRLSSGKWDKTIRLRRCHNRNSTLSEVRDGI